MFLLSSQVAVPVTGAAIDLKARWGQLMGMGWFFEFWQWLPESDPNCELVRCRDTLLDLVLVCNNCFELFFWRSIYSLTTHVLLANCAPIRFATI